MRKFSPLSPKSSSLRALAILLVLFSGVITKSLAQTSTEFWFAPPEVTSGHAGDTPIYLRLAAGADPATVTIDMPANPGALNSGSPITVVLAANSAQTVNLSAFVADLETTPTHTVLNTGLHISATADITAIYEVSPTNNPDIWALKGANGLGTEFYAPMQNLWENGNYTPQAYSSFDIVATEDNTTILIYPTADLDGGQNAYQSFTITLDEGETYSASVTDRQNPENNPTGSIIVSDKPIAVSIKDDSITPPSYGCRDLVGDQIVPVDIVGDEYIVNRGGLYNDAPEWAYVVATQNNTEISIDGVVETTLFNAETYPIQIDNPLTYITGDKPFYLIHVSGFGCEAGMALLPPLNCAGSEQVSFVRSTTESFFINLLVSAGHEDAFVLNGDAGIIDPADFDPVPGTGGAWLGAQIQFNTTEIPQGVNNLIVNTEEVFSMGLINGGASSGCRFGYFSQFSAEIIVDAGPDQTVCANRDTELAGDVTGGATQGEWTTDGTGTFSPDANTFNAIYVPSLADLSAGQVTLTLTSISNCFPVEDEVEITYTPAPVVVAGTDILACENNTTVTLDGFIDVATGGIWSGGAGTFDPTTGTLDAEYTPTAGEVTAGSVTLTLTSTGNGTCLAETDQVEITFGPAPTADAGMDQTLCGNNADTQLNGSVTIAGGGQWSGGNGSYAPSDQSLTAVYTPSAAEIAIGSVTLTLTTTDNSGCSAVSDDVLLTFTDAPEADAGSDQSFCENNADITLNGSISIATGATWTGGTGTYAPDANTLNAVYSPSLGELIAGSVTLTLTTTGSGDCLEVSDDVTFTFTDAPIVEAGAGGTVCSNNADITLNGSLTGATVGLWSGGGGSFNPNTTTLNAVYSPSAAEITSGSVTLTLTSLDNGTCNPESDDVTFSFSPPPTANAGVDQSVCENNADVTLAGSVTIASGGQWSGGAGIFTPDNSTLNAIYTPTAGELFAGSLTLTLTTTGNGTCSPETDDVVITFTDAPTADAGVDQTLCANNADITLAGGVTLATGGSWSGGLGVYTPDNTTLNAVYQPTAGEIASGNLTLTLTTTGNATCNAVTDEVDFTFTPAPVVDAGAPISVCSNNSQVTMAGSVTVSGGGTWSGGAGSFIPNANALNALYNPTAAEIAAGTLNLTLTSTGNGTCSPEVDVVTITFTPPPTANAGTDQTVCGNNAVVNLNGNVSLASGGVWSGGSGTFNPNNTTLGAAYTPSAAEISNGTVTLTLTTTGNGTCLAVDDEMTITITPAPTVEAGAGAVLCANNADINLNGSVTVATGGTWSGGSGTFTPDAATLNAVYTPSATELSNGTVTLTLTSTGNASCSVVTDNVTYTFSPAPTADAGVNQTLCENNADVTLAGAVTIAGGGAWSGGAGSYSPNANALNAVYTPTAGEITAGSVTLTLTTTGNGSCNPVTDDVEITFTPGPTVNPGMDVTVCANDPDVNLNGSVTIATGGTWTGGFGTFSPDANTLFTTYTPSAGEIAAGTVTLTLNSTGNGNCNPATEDIVITITPPPTVDAGIGAEYCANNADITLNGSVTIASGGTWSGGGGAFAPNASTLNAIYTPTAGEISSGSVTLTLTTTGNNNCVSVTDNVTYTFGDAPVADAGAPISVCSNNADAILNGSVTNATGGTWSGGAGSFSNVTALNATYTPTAGEITAGSVTLTLTTTGNGNCNPESDDVVISFTASPTANAGSDATVCANDPDVNLNGQVTVATGGIWSGGNGSYSAGNTTLGSVYTPSPAEIAAGTVTLTLTTTGNGNCLAVSDDMVITITPTPVVDAGIGTQLCGNNPDISLNGSVTVATGGAWSGGSGSFAPDANTLNAVYTPSQSEINNGSITLTLTSTGNGDCIQVTDNVTYTFGPSPTVDAGPDQVLCDNNAAALMAGSITIATGATWSGGAGTFAPNANTLNATYTPTAAELTAGTVTLTLTTTGNGNCLPETDDMTIVFTDAPTANAGVDQTVCGNNPDVNLSGSVSIATGGTWSGGFGTYSPNANSLFATYTPSLGEIAAGTVTLTLTTSGNGNCTAVTDQIEITITPAPTVNAGSDDVYCANNVDIALNGSVTTATGGTWSGGNGTFTPDVNTLNATYTPSVGEISAGTVTLTLTSSGNANCIAVSDFVTYTISPAPTVDAGADQVLCANDPAASISGSITVAAGATWSGGAGTFAPNANSLNATYTPTAAELTAGTVTLTLTTTGNGDCLAESDDVVITYTPAPTSNAGIDQTVCANTSGVNLTGSVTIATGGTWSGGFGTYTPNANSLFATYTPSLGEIAAGTVTLTLTTTGNGNCLAVSDQMEITITPDPQVDAGIGTQLCGNNADISLNGSVTIATGGTWSGGSGTFTPDANDLNAVYSPSQSEINSGTLTLTLTSTGNGNCAVVTDNVTYTFTPAPTVDAGVDQSICENNAAISLAGAITVSTGATWSGGAGTFAPNANALNAVYTPTPAEIAGGTLTLTLTTTGNGNCLAETDDIEITFTPSPTADAGADMAVCGNDPEANLNAFVTVASGGIWSGGNGTFTPNNTNLGAVYAPSPAEIAAGTVTLTLTTTGNGNCIAVTDDIVITIADEPTAEAGIGFEVCANDPDIDLNGSVTIATGGAWSGGNGTFTPDANTLNAVYTPSQSEINAGTVTLTLTTTGNGNCIAVTDNVTFSFGPSPVVDAGSDETFCANNASISLGGSVIIATGGTWTGGAGTYFPNANTPGATYTPTAGELASGTLTLTLTSTGNGNCLAESDDVVFTFTPAPTANAGIDQDACANNALINLNGQVTVATGGIWTGGNGTYNPNNTTLGAVYTPSPAELAAGTVTLTLTTTGNGLCNAVTDQMEITIAPAPVVEAGVGAVYCENNADITLNGSVINATGGTWSGGSGTFTPNASTLNAVYSPSLSEINAGTLVLTLTSTGNGDCLAETDNVTYTFSPAPTADAGIDQTLCANNADVSLSGAVTIATGGTWSGGAGNFANANNLNTTYTPDAADIAAGFVTLTLTTTGNASCLPESDNITITFTPAPTANAGGDVTVCENNSLVSLSASVSIATGGSWSGGAGTFTPDANTLNPTYQPTPAELAAGTLTLTFTTTGNGTCNPVSDDMTITVTPPPAADAGIGTMLCANNADITLGGSVIGATGGTWSGGSGTFTPDANDLNAVYEPSAGEIAAGTLTLTLTTTGNSTCNASTDNVTYTFSPAPTADAGIDQTLCANNAVITLGGAVTIATGGTWSGGAGSFANANNLNTTYTPDAADIAAGFVTLTLTTTGNASCLPESDNITITFTPAPTANAGSDQTICANNADVNLNGGVSIATGGTWSGGAGTFNPDANTLNAVYTPSAGEIGAGTVTLTLTTTGNALCNPVSDDMVITITPAPIVNAGIGTELCSNNADITLAGSVTGATGGTWSGGSGTFTPNANDLNAVYTPSAGEISAGTLTLTLSSTGNGTCTAITNDVTYTFGPAPTADAGADEILCANNADVNLAGAVTVATGGTWSGGAGSFANANSLNTVYTPDAADITAGFVTLTLTTTGNGACLPESDNITITFTPAPTANAGADQTLCENNSDVTLNGSISIATGATWSGGAGTFTPDANTLNAVYEPTAGELAAGSVTLTLTTTGNGNCTPVSDDMTITITSGPIVDAGIGTELCSNNADINLSGSVNGATGGAWSGGSGTFTPDANTLNAVYTPSAGEIAAGTLTLTLTSTGNGNCIVVSDNVTYTFGPAPTADAGLDQTLCANNSIASLAGIVTVATGGTWSGGAGSFANANSLNTTYTPDAADITAGSVTLTLTTTGNGSCLPESDEITIDFTPAPTVNAGLDQTVCANNDEVTLNGSISISTGATWSGGAGTFSPDANALNAIYTPTAAEEAAGTVTLTLTTTGNGNCNAVSDEMVITISPAPIVNAGVDMDVCSNNSTFNLAGNVQNAGGGEWSGGLGIYDPSNDDLNALYTPTLPETIAGSVTFTLTSTDNNGCIEVTDEVTVTFTPGPTVDAGEDQTLCAASPIASIAGAFTVAGGVQWSGGNGTFFPNVLSQNVDYTPTPAEIANGSVTLTLTTTGNGNCLPETDEITLFFDPEPTVSAGVDLNSCENNPTVTLGGSFTDATGVEWTGGQGFFDPNDQDPTAEYTPSNIEIANGFATLTLTTFGSGACPDVNDEMTISINPAPVVDAGLDFEVCANNSNIDLNGSVQFASGGIWSGGTGAFVPNSTALNATYMPTPAEIATGFITLTLTSQGNGTCNPETDDITVTFTPSPLADAGVDVSICENNADVQLNGSFTVADGANWSGGAGSFTPDNSTPNAIYTPSETELANGSVTLTITTFGNGDCLPASDQMTISFTPAPEVAAGDDQFICVDDLDAALSGTVTGGTTTGLWSTSGSGNFLPNASVLNATYQVSSADSLIGEVTLTLTSTNNGTCNAVMDEMTIFILPAGTSDAGPDQTVCANNGVVSVAGVIGGTATSGVWSSTGTGTFSPSNDVTDVTYTPSEADLLNGSATLTFAVNSCNLASDDVVITYSPAPVVDAGTDGTYCASDISGQLAGSVSGASATGIWTTTNGTGTFLPSNTDLNAVYQWSAADIDLQVIEIVLESTNIGDCIAVTDTVIINVFPQGVANAGEDVVACANNPEVQLNGSLTGADIPLWTTNGTGTFAPSDDILINTYVPSDADILSGSVTITLHAVNSCNAATDEMEISFVPSPIVDAGPDQAECGTITPFTISGSVQNAGGGLWTSTGTGTFQNATDLNTFYVASQADVDQGGVYLILNATDIGDCFAVADSLFLSLSNGIQINAGGDQEVCVDAGNAQLFATISNGSTTGQWSTTGNGSFLPSSTDLDATYQFTQDDIDAGSITFTLVSTNNGICPQVQDSFEMTFGNSAFVHAGVDVEVCETTSSVPLSGIVSGETNTGVWSTTGDGTFIPNNTTLTPTYEPGPNDYNNGSAVIILTSTGSVLCSEGSSQMVITLRELPEADAGADIVICSEIEPVQLTGSVNNGGTGIWSTSGTGTFSPDETSLNAFYIPSEADSIQGMVSLTLTTTDNGDCPADMDQVNISFSEAVIANAGADQEVCENQNSVAVLGNIEGTSVFQWSTSGTGTFSPDATTLNALYEPTAGDVANGSIQIYLSAGGDGICPAQLDSLTLSFDLLPVINTAAAIDACVVDDDVILTSDVTNADDILWTSTGGGVFSPDNTSEDVTYTPTPAEVASGSTILTLSATSNGDCGLVSTDVTITFRDIAIIDAGTDAVACADDGSVGLNGAVQGAGYGAQWSTTSFGSFNPDATDLNADYDFGGNDVLIGGATVILTSTNNGACPAVTDTMEIVINSPPTVFAGDDDFVCQSAGIISLNGNVENADSFEWTTAGDGVFLPSGTELNPDYVLGNVDGSSGSVILTLTGVALEGCSDVSDAVTITISNPLDADFSASAACAGSTVQFTDQTKVFAGQIDGWRWDFGNGNISNEQNPDFVFNDVGAQSVELIVQSSIGCNDTITQIINVVDGPTANFSMSANPAPINFEIDFTDASENAEQWIWDFGDNMGVSFIQNPVYSYDEAGVYEVTLYVEGAGGCLDSLTSNITIDGVLVLPPRLPNSFSPNGDGQNDVYKVRGGPFVELEFIVYDGWGSEIFKTTDQDQGWDGTENGKQSPIGVYVYTVVATTVEGETFDYSGRINLIR